MAAADHFGLADSPQFMGYWKLLKPHLCGGSLPVEQGMKRLNNVRVELKHRGTQPSQQSIEDALTNTKTFLEMGTKLVFDVDYETVSMVDVIPQPEVKALAKNAEDQVQNGKIVVGMARLREAWEELFNEERPSGSIRRGSPLTFSNAALSRLRRKAYQAKRTLGYQPAAHHDLGEVLMELGRLEQGIQPLQLGVRLAALAIDYGAFVRFDRLVPLREQYDDESTGWIAPAGYAPEQEEFEFCRQFVVTAALRLAAAEGHAADPVWLQRNDKGGISFHRVHVDPEPTSEAADG